MKQSMREQLQVLVSLLGEKYWLQNTHYEQHIVKVIRGKLEAILAASQPSVSVKAGWYAKDYFGVHWFERKPTWFGEWDYEIEMRGKFASAEDIGGGITDLWETSHPNGGPECIMEVKP